MKHSESNILLLKYPSQKIWIFSIHRFVLSPSASGHKVKLGNIKFTILNNWGKVIFQPVISARFSSASYPKILLSTSQRLKLKVDPFPLTKIQKKTHPLPGKYLKNICFHGEWQNGLSTINRMRFKLLFAFIQWILLSSNGFHSWNSF